MKTRATVWGWVALSLTVVPAAALADDSQGAPVVSITAQPAAGPSIDARVTKLERVVEGQALADLLDRIQRLQEDVQRLRGDLEVQANDLNGVKQRQRDLYLDIDRRLRQLEVSATTGPAAMPSAAAAVPPPASLPQAAVPAAPSSSAAAAAASNPEREQVAYQKAFDLLKGGHYDDAIAAFREVLAAYPNGKLADNAQYWLGEAHFAARRFREAADEFSKVLGAYPQSAKVPDAMLKLGFSDYELGDWAKARQNLEQVLAHYPQSTAAQLADRRLQRMKLEGH